MSCSKRLGIVVSAVLATLAVAPVHSQSVLDFVDGKRPGASLVWVRNCGDIDSDGISDLVTMNFPMIGVLSGADRSWIFQEISGPPNVTYGFDMDGAGDFNGDGCADFMTGTGIIGNRVVVFSGTDGSVIATMHGAILPQNTSEELGRRIAGVGDLNGDGYDDIIAVGAFGLVRVYLGPTGTLLRTHLGPGTRPAVEGVGDIDGDGVPDYLAGFQQGNRVVAYSGADGAELYVLFGDGITYFGADMAGIGDIDGDGVPDFIVGAPGELLGFGEERGRVRIFSGATGTEIARFEGPEETDSAFGVFVAGGSDINGDGTPDFIVGAPSDDTLPYNASGAVHVYSGKTLSLLWIVRPPTEHDRSFGIRVGLLDDLDGDGYADFGVGSDASYNGHGAGRLWFYSGAPGDATRTCTAAPNSTGSAASLSADGPISVKNGELALTTTGGVPGQLALLVYGPPSMRMPAGDGVLCIGSALGTGPSIGLVRLPPAQVFDAQGTTRHTIDFTSGPIASGSSAWSAGSTWTVQAAYRDPAGPGGSGFNFTDALRIEFMP